MTASLDHSSQTIQQLIDSCFDSMQSFRNAAELLGNGELRRLFAIYAQQRARFAEELRGFAAVEVLAAPSQPRFLPGSNDEVMLDCLQREYLTLALYRKAIAERKLPTKAHFLVSAQLALLEKVHSRIQALTRPTMNALSGKRIAI